VLIIAPATSVDNWHSNWEFWGGPEVNVVSYVGSTAARALLHDHELWLTPESLDSKSSFLQKQGLPAKVSSNLLCHMSSYTRHVESALRYCHFKSFVR
jgi:hypothetical protein